MISARRSRFRLSLLPVWFSLAVLACFALVAALAPRLAPHDPYYNYIARSNLPPMWVEGGRVPGNAEFPLGTDRFGRDVLSRMLYGARTATCLALTAVPLAAVLGTLVGLVAGYAGRRLDGALIFIMDVIQSLPGIMFMVIIVLIFRSLLAPSWGHGLLTLVVGYAAVSWVGLARLVRSQVLQLRSQLFIEAAVSLGASPWRVLTRHLLPNVLHLILVWIINNVPAIILLEAVLGYIGIGITSVIDGGEFTVTSWGGMFFSGRATLNLNPWMLIIPSVCILLMSMSFIVLADHLGAGLRRDQALGIEDTPVARVRLAAGPKAGPRSL